MEWTPSPHLLAQTALQLHRGLSIRVVGPPLPAGAGAQRGAVHILRLNADGTVKAEQRISDDAGGFPFTLEGFGWFGSAVAGLGDIDADGVPDLLVGTEYDSSAAASESATASVDASWSCPMSFCDMSRAVSDSQRAVASAWS